MNRVGEKGEGESVWLGWFLYATLTAFAPLAAARGETARAEHWTMHADALKVALEREAWDGEWYVRGYFDDGTPLGSSRSDECRIDSIAQSWAVLSGAATQGRALRAMASLDRELIRRDDGLALLFAPPFDKTRDRSRLHQRISPRRARERRAIHACRDLVGDGLRRAGRWRQGGGTLRHAQSDQPFANPR